MDKEYIERERAKEHLIGDYAYAAAKMLDEIPAADVVEVKHGEWIYCPETPTLKPHFYCSVCKDIRTEHYANMFKHCPNCGAKMDGKEGAENAI